MSAERNQIIKFCEEYLQVKKFEDYCHNGLQVEGTGKINKIITGVSFSRALIEKAIEKKAQMIIVHHGIFGNAFEKPPVIKNFMRNRLKLLLTNDINLAGFHLPLDAHPIIGNNISLCRLLGVKNPQPFAVGFYGSLNKEVGLIDLTKLINKKLNTKSSVVFGGNGKVKKLGIVSGGASTDFVEAAELGADTLLCGDLQEHVVRAAEEMNINIINAGHYNTEKLGIQNLGNLIAKKFKIKAEFVDIPCEI